MDRNITINNKSGSGNGGNYFSNKTQGGGYSTSGMVQVELVEVLVVLIRTAVHMQTAMTMHRANMLIICLLIQ